MYRRQDHDDALTASGRLAHPALEEDTDSDESSGSDGLRLAGGMASGRCQHATGGALEVDIPVDFASCMRKRLAEPALKSSQVSVALRATVSRGRVQKLPLVAEDNLTESKARADSTKRAAETNWFPLLVAQLITSRNQVESRIRLSS